MIKVKKAWRKAEEEIIKACRTLPLHIKLGTGSFGTIISEDNIRVTDCRNTVCPLGARLLGSNADIYQDEVIGVTPCWIEGFWNGVDCNPYYKDNNNEWRAGYQAGKRVARMFDLE